jgi:hypothetical protein
MTDVSAPAGGDGHGRETHPPEDGQKGHGHEGHGHEGHVHDHEHEPAQLREALKERLIDLKGLSPELKFLVGISVVILGFLTVMAVLRNEQIGTLVSNDYFSEDGQKAAYMPLILFVAAIGFVSFAWALIVTAAARSGWVARIATLVALGLAFGSARIAVTDINLATTVIVSVLLGVIALILIGTWIPERNAHHRSDPKKLNAGNAWRVLRRLVLPVSFLIFLAVYLYIWHEGLVNGLGGISQGVPADENANAEFGTSVGVQLDNMQYLLIPMLVLAGADFGDWGYFATSRAFRRVRLWSSEIVTAVVGLVVSIAIVVDGFRIASSDDGSGTVAELVMAGVVAAVVVVLLFLMKPRDGWSAHYPFVMIAVAVALDGVFYFVITQYVTSDGNRSDGYDALTWLGMAAIGMVVLLVSRQRGPRWLAYSAGFAVLIGAVYTMTSFDSINSIVSINGWDFDSAPFLWFEGLKAAAGVIAIAVIVVAAVTGRLRVWIEPIVMLVSVAVSIQVLAWLASLYQGAINHGGQAAGGGQLGTFSATVMVLALSWEFGTSGEAITNGHHRHFPRDSRVMAFVGYVLLTATVSVFWSGIGDLDGGKWKLIESQFEAESFVEQGLMFVGVPLVILIFILRFNTWRQKQAQPGGEHHPAASPEPVVGSGQASPAVST